MPSRRPRLADAASDWLRRHKRQARRSVRRAPADATVGTRVPALLAQHQRLLGDSDRKRVVVVLADGHIGGDLVAYLEFFARDSIVVIAPECRPEWRLEEFEAMFRPSTTLTEVNWALRFLGPLDVIVDLCFETADAHDQMWRKLFFHLRPHGLYLLRRESVVDGRIPPAMLETTEWIGIPVREQDGRSPQQRELALATGSLSISTEAIAVEKRNRHLLKVREAQANRILPTREPKLTTTVLARESAGSFAPTGATVSHNPPDGELNLPTVIDYPELCLRHYQGRVAMVANGLLHTSFSALPDSFRHHGERILRNARLVDANADFARVPARQRPTRTLAGNYYHLDCENSGHFGHLMTEVVGRLWGWDEAKRLFPDLKAIFRRRWPNEREPSLERALFTAYGIAAEDIVYVDEPVWLESVVAATPMWHNAKPHYVHPGITRTWQRLREAIVTETDSGPDIFVSRRDQRKNRACRNATEVEQFFRDRGFEVIYPEDHDLGEQAAIFAQARVIAGFGGSAMFNLLFAEKVHTVIVLNHDGYRARNEHLYTTLLDADTHYFWSRPDVSHPTDGGWSAKAYRSEWEFDFDHNEAELSSLIASSTASITRR